ANRIRFRKHAGILDTRMRTQDALHFRARDIVAGGDDQVVPPAAKPEPPGRVPRDDVAGQVPSVAHVASLRTLASPVDASRRSSYGEPPGRSGCDIAQIVVHDAHLVAGHRCAE